MRILYIDSSRLQLDREGVSQVDPNQSFWARNLSRKKTRH